MTLTADLLHERLNYDPATGVFTWKRSRGPKKAGSRAGSLAEGYRIIEIDSQPYKEHRLAWFLTYGCWPAGHIDHINGQKDDNRMSNLRDVSASTNGQNQRRPPSHNTTGLMGVSWSEHFGKYIAQITVQGKKVHLGYFTDPSEAATAYLAAKRKLHEGCTI